ncbi:MAG: DegT/DnrJ/EryC1/StrS family aminotransferase [Methanomicrobiales archaeon]|jgi:8-amino-3,8-dideoxy-alpha-D-manno-octulosonate transaminase
MPGFELMGREEREAVNEVFDRGGVLYRYGFDEMRQHVFKVAEFEAAFAGKFGVRHAQAVTSGTAALKVALKAMGIGPGDEVITQCHTFVATVEAIIEARATPVISEVDRSLNMDPGDFEAKISSRTRAVIPVHMLGSPARMREILSIAGRNGIMVLEDAAQAPGGEYLGKKLGTLGTAGCFSFDYGKVITTGEGGMVVTDREDVYRKAREYTDHGHEYNPLVPRGEDTRTGWGFNYKMMELQGAIGLAQLKKLDDALQRQRENKRKIKEGIRDLPGISFREIPDPRGEIGDALVFFLDDAASALRCAAQLRGDGIGTKNLPDAIQWHYAGTWDHMLAFFERYRGRDLMREWPVSTDLISRAIALPVLIRMDGPVIERMVDRVRKAVERVTGDRR